MSITFLNRFVFVNFYFYASLSFIIPILYWNFSFMFEHLVKLPYYLALISIVVVLVYKRFILDDWFIVFLAFYGGFLLLYGLVNNPIGKAHVAHIQPLMLPVLGVSYGYLVAKMYPHILTGFYKFLPVLGVFLLVSGVIYFYLYKIGNLSYFGASSLFILPLIWALLEKKKFLVLLFLIGIIISGKRSDLLSSILLLFIFLYRQNPKVFIVILLPLGMFFLTLLVETGIFSRFVEIYNAVDFSQLDLVRINEATSNRLNDILGAISSINESPFYWVFGQGFGVTYEYNALSSMHTVHYTHFSPISYILLGGLVLLIPIVVKFSYLFYFSVINYKSFFNLLFIYLCFLSLVGGAIFFTNPFFWIVVGIVVFNSRKIIKKRLVVSDNISYK